MNTLSKLMHKEFCMMVINHQHLFTSSKIEIPDGCLKEIKKNSKIKIVNKISFFLIFITLSSQFSFFI